VRRIAAHTACAAGAEAEAEYRRGYPSVVNDPALTERCAKILRKRFGRTNIEQIDRMLPGEDFAYSTAHCPGFFVELGENEEKQSACPHHNSLYRLDGDALQYGVQYYFDAVRSLLGWARAPRRGGIGVMRLTILADNHTIIDRYYLGEPAFSCLLQDGAHTVLFNTGYSDVFLRNAEAMGFDLSKVTDVLLSHWHNDHTGGLSAFFERFHRCVRLYAQQGTSRNGADYKRR